MVGISRIHKIPQGFLTKKCMDPYNFNWSQHYPMLRSNIHKFQYIYHLIHRKEYTSTSDVPNN